MKQNYRLLLVILFGMLVSIQALEGCKYVSISTGTESDGEFKYDVMKNGLRNSFWSVNEETQKDSVSTELDFFYVTVHGKHDQLTLSSFKISTNNTLSSNTTLFIEKVVELPNQAGRTYSVRINYKCNEDAAQPLQINFKVDENFPICKGSPSNVFWTRICGDNEPPRMGLSLTYDVHRKHNFTIIEDGRLVNADYFSEEYDTYVLRIPSKIDYSMFYIYLNRSEEIFKHNEITLDDVEKLFDSDKEQQNKLLANQLQFAQQQAIEPIELNYDVQILDVFVRGGLREGGLVTFEPEPIYLQFICKRGGITGVQLTIPMPVFKNVNIFFEKECPLMSGEGGAGFFSMIAFVTFLLLIAVALVTLYNVFVKNEQGIKAVPFAVKILNGLSSVPIISNSPIGRSLYSLANPTYDQVINPISNQISQSERSFQNSEFKIKNISEEKAEENEQADSSTIEVNEQHITEGIQPSPTYGSI